MKPWVAAISVAGLLSAGGSPAVAIQARYQVIAHVFPGADSGLSVGSKRYSATLSVGQRAVVGPSVKAAGIELSSGFQAMIEGWGSRLAPALRPESLLSPAAKRELVTSTLQAHKQLYGYAGSLGYDAAKALVARRNAATAEMIDKLASLGPGGAQILADVYGGVETVREKEMLIKALGRIEDPNAPAMLKEMLGGNDEFSMRREMIASLGKRSEQEAESVLGGLVDSTDQRIGMAAVQGLSGRPGAVGTLSKVMESDTAGVMVRQEAVRSLGLVGDAASRDALAVLALKPGELSLRQTAIQELGRSYGEESLLVLDQLLSDPDDTIRNNAVKAVSRVNSPAAKDLLKRVAEKDTSPAVREMAGAYLAVAAPATNAPAAKPPGE